MSRNVALNVAVTIVLIVALLLTGAIWRSWQEGNADDCQKRGGIAIVDGATGQFKECWIGGHSPMEDRKPG